VNWVGKSEIEICYLLRSTAIEEGKKQEARSKKKEDIINLMFNP